MAADGTRNDYDLATEPTSPRQVLVILFITLLFAYAYVHQEGFKSPIPASRLDLLHAIFVHRTVCIDSYHENTPDKATYGEHYYSDKAPAVATLALPGFAVAVVLLTAFDLPLDSSPGWLISSWIACVGSVGLITALGGVALFVWLSAWVQPRHAYLTVLGLFLGGAPFLYSTLLMSHALVIGLLSISLWASEAGLNEIGRPPQVRRARDILAGCCCGLALAAEYSSGMIVMGILLSVTGKNLRRVFPLALAMVPPLILIPAYHWFCFGTPFTIAYHHEAVFKEMHQGFFGIRFPPNLANILSLLVGPQRGLFFWSPILLMALVGYFRVWPISVVFFWLTYLVPLLQVVVISGYYSQSAGGLVGPRLLAPTLPLLALPTALGIARFPHLGSILAVISILLTTLVTVVSITPPMDVNNPLVQFHIPAFLNGKLSYTLGSIFGLPGYASVTFLTLGLGLCIWLSWRRLRRNERTGLPKYTTVLKAAVGRP